ncbi:VOC family protein [Roseicella aerolata]|uniref:VOC family protein n=1 Tax=Roseicella aerolata TaxID=2883479 RepID=A0A9X1IG42_9PROT|nr:VOC family protein [Roseicella aerolata]MCB4823053.1 VOC family protein [Roseicella aerolata]
MAINRLDHAAIFTPDLGKALAWYVDVLSMKVLERTDDHVHLSCQGEVGELTLVRGGSGIRDFTFGVDDKDDLDRVAAILSSENVAHGRTGGGSRPGEGPALAFTTPSGHSMRLAVGDAGRRAGVTSFASKGSHAPCGMDHINITGEVDPRVMQSFLALIGFKFSFSVAVGGRVAAVWLRSSAYDHDIAYTRAFRPTDRLHHVAFSVEDGNHYFRLSDRLMDHRLRWEFGPGRHNVGLGRSTGFGTNNYAYILDPGGNRNEFSSGMGQFNDDAEPRLVSIEPHQMADVMNGWGHEHPESMMLGS